MSRKAFFMFAFGLFTVLAGCRTESYRARSTLFADGSVERTINQPLADTPAPALKADLWKSMDIVKKKGDPDRVQASGKFPSVKDIPDALVFGPKSPNELLVPLLPSSKLARQHLKTDYVFVTEHRWTETLTDTVTIAGLRQGREELAKLAIDLGQDIFAEVLGKDYDATELVKWLRSDGKAWLTEASDYVLMQFLAHRRAGYQDVKDIPEHILAGFADICDRYGLQLRENGKFIRDDKKMQKVAEEFTVNLVCQKVRHRGTNRPVERATVLAWQAELQKESQPHDKNPPGRFEEAAKKVIKAKYGSKELLEVKVGAAYFKIGGVHFMGAPANFEYTMEMPGPVVQTNGTILAANKVRWQFAKSEAWPFGHSMTCRALQAHDDLQKDLLKGRPLSGPEAMLELVTLMSQEPQLVDVLKKCRFDRSLAPLHKLRQQLQDPKMQPGASLDRVNGLYKLLNLPLDGR